MFTDHVVILPKSQTPVFPELCAVCGSPNPQNHLKCSTPFLDSSNGGPIVHLQVPACMSCASTVRGQGLFRVLAWVLLISAAVAILFFLPESWQQNRLVYRLTRGFLIFASVILMLGWSFIFPKHFEFSTTSDSSLYAFKSEEAAAAFKKLNGAKDQEK
jgi:hypothetical protein